MNNVYIKTYNSPPINKREILRYAGVNGESKEIESLLDECLTEVTDAFTYKVCYAEFDVKNTNGIIDLGFTQAVSINLEKNLKDASSIILFAATVGIKIDRLIARSSAKSAAKSLLFQAIGTERVESLCDLFCEEVREEKSKNGYETMPRYSPGYGDLSLDIQKEIFSVLDCQRKIGISLSEGLIMTPSKSVTAIIGLKKKAN